MPQYDAERDVVATAELIVLKARFRRRFTALSSTLYTKVTS